MTNLTRNGIIPLTLCTAINCIGASNHRRLRLLLNDRVLILNFLLLIAVGWHRLLRFNRDDIFAVAFHADDIFLEMLNVADADVDAVLWGDLHVFTLFATWNELLTSLALITIICIDEMLAVALALSASFDPWTLAFCALAVPVHLGDILVALVANAYRRAQHAIVHLFTAP